MLDALDHPTSGIISPLRLGGRRQDLDLDVLPHGGSCSRTPESSSGTNFREGRARYEQMRDSHPTHLNQSARRQVIEFTSEEIEKLQAEIARQLGYKAGRSRLELYCVPLDEDKT